jgi:tRNA-guanine family transglycosylase
MNWERALITDSGGFQVFSLAHGGVANEVKGSGRSGDHGSKVEISEEGARFQSPRDGSELFISPEVSMSVQARLGSDIALVFDECTPFHADREYTAASPGMASTGPSAKRSSGSSRAGPTRICGGNRPRPSPRPGSTGSRSAAPSAATRRRWPPSSR